MEGSSTSTRLVSGIRAADSDHGALARAGYFLTCAGSRPHPSSQSRRCDLSEDHDPAEAILPRAARRVRVMNDEEGGVGHADDGCGRDIRSALAVGACADRLA